MLQAVEATIEPSGVVRLLEEVNIVSPRRAIVTLLDSVPTEQYETGNSDAILKFLSEHRLPPSARFSAEEIDAQTETERNAL